MKFKFLIPLFSISILLIGCGEEQKEEAKNTENKFEYDTTRVIETEPIENPKEIFELNYKFSDGGKYSYRLTTISEDRQKIIADTTLTQNVKQEIIYLIDLNLDKKDENGILEFTGVVNSIKLSADAGGKKYLYESGVTIDSTEKARYADYESLVNNNFNVRISTKGNVEEIFRTDNIVNTFLELKGYADSVTAKEKNSLRQDLVNGLLTPILTQIFRQLPEETVGKDSSWLFTQTPMNFMVFQLTNTNKYELNDLAKLNDKKVAVIDASMVTKVEGERQFTERGVSYDFENPITKSSGTIYFNIDDGLVQRSKTNLEINLNYSMQAQTQQGMQKGNKEETITTTNILERLK